MQHTEGTFQGKDGTSLFFQSWRPDSPARAGIILVHGLGEHSGRFNNLVEYLVPRGYSVFTYDQRGHGKSKGKRGYVKRFQDYLADLDIYAGMVRNGGKTFLFGHSMGGTVASAYAVEHQDQIDGLILSAPLFKAGESVTQASMAAAKVLSVVLPHLGVAPIDATGVSRDQAVVQAYLADPLVFHGKLSARLGAELIKVMRELPPRFKELKLPTLIMQATDDRLANPEGAMMAYDRLGTKDRTLRLFPGLFHEIMNEPERVQVLEDLLAWLTAHS
jgi:acylglycerol lipase